MKKKIIIVLFICLMSVIQTSLAVERIEDIPGGRNLLNLHTIYTLGNPNNARDFTHMIAVNNGSTYTIVVDYDYFNSQVSNLTEFEYEYYPSGDPHSFPWDNDTVNERVYVEFVPLADLINIVAVPVPQGNTVMNYNIILYQGDYASFEGFEPYVSEGFEYEVYGTLEIDYDQMMSLTDISNLIVAKDADGNQITKTVISDTYSSSDKLPGDYEIVFEAISNQLTRNYILGITVYDHTAPMIGGPSTLSYEFTERPDVSVITNQLTVSDNVDELLPSDIQVVLNTYNGATGIGEYEIRYEVEDASGNIGQKTVYITLVDTTPPNIIGPTDLYIYTTDTPYTDADLINLFSANDVIDGNCYVELMDNNYLGTTISGIYDITIFTIDSHFNEATRVVYIHVIDNRGPSFEADALVIETTPSEVVSMNDVISDFISFMGQSGIDIDDVEISYSEYDDHEEIEGHYYVYLSYTIDGVEETARVLISVEDDSPVFSPLYALGIIPIIGIGAIIFVKKRRS